MPQERYDAGLAVRRDVIGAEAVDRMISGADSFNREFQELVTEFCWGGTWARGVLERKTRSMLNLCLLSALNRPHEFKLHFRGALRNGCTLDELKEVLLQVHRLLRYPGGRRGVPAGEGGAGGAGDRPGRGDVTSAGRYGFVGLGNMGGPMAANLSRSGVEVVAFDAAGTRERAPARARAAASLADLAASTETVFLSLPDGPAVLDVVAEVGAAPDRSVETVVDLSTVGIGHAQRAFAEASALGLRYVDAPVSGGRSGAVEATIAMMWAGPADVLEAHRPALAAMAKHVFHVGTRAGQGQALKLLNNFLSATATAATGEALLFGLAHGLELQTMLDVVNVSTGRSHASADKYVRRVLTGSFDSGFATRLMAKDVRLYVEAAAAGGTPRGIASVVRSLWDAVDAGLPGSDHTEVFAFLRDGGAASP